MNRSITENIVVVLAVAIAVSLLASACGPNKMKTLKNGKLDVLPNVVVDTRTTEEKVADVLKEVQQPTPGELDEGSSAQPTQEKIAVDISKATEFASRLSYIQFVHQNNASQMLFKAMVEAKNGNIYEITFTGASFDSSGKIVQFASNVSKEVLADNKLSDKAAVLPYDAKAIVLEEGLAVVSITERENMGANAKSAEISAIVRSDVATANTNSNDKALSLMKDASIKSRITQIFVADSSASNAQRPIQSLANRIIINIADSKSKDGLFDLYARFQPDNSSAQVFASNVSNELKGFDSKYNISIESGDTFINTDTVSIVFKSKTEADKVDSVVLSLSKKAVEQESTPDAGDEEIQVEDQATENNSDEPTKFEVYTETSTFSGVRSKVSSTEDVVKPDFSNVRSGVKSDQQIVRPDFSNVQNGQSKDKTSAAKKVPSKKAKISGGTYLPSERNSK